MQSRDINDILAKINEMRAVFVLGQRAVPFLEEVFVFLREISPLLDDINRSIRDSTSKMPRATSQLQSVTEATELATTEILDLVDAVLEQLSPLRSHLDETAGALETIHGHDAAAERIVMQTLEQHDLTVPEELRQVWEARRMQLASLQKECFDEQQALGDIRESINRIMISLQVQDITAQQLASVNHLIESIRARMTALVDRLGRSPQPTPDDAWPVYSHATFDPHARYDGDGVRQEMIDEVFLNGVGEDESAKEVEQPEPEAPITDALIDQLFTACYAEPPRPIEARPQPQPTDSSGPASQEEIDALFQNGLSS